jgi:hypothetical protein
MGYRYSDELEKDDPASDSYALRVRRFVAVTPLSLDLTSRVDLSKLEASLREA